MIKIKEEVIIGEYILEKNDRIKILSNAESLQENSILVNIKLRGSENLEDIIQKIMLEARMGRNLMDIETKLIGKPEESLNNHILYGSSLISQKFIFASQEGIFKSYTPIGILASSKKSKIWVEIENKIIEVTVL